VPGERRTRHADGGPVRAGHRGRGGRRCGAARRPSPERPAHRAARPRCPVRPSGRAACGSRPRGRPAAGRPAVLRRRGHAVDVRDVGPRPTEHGSRPHRVLSDRLQRIRPRGGVRPGGRVAEPFPGQPGHRILAAVRVRHRQRVRHRPGGRRRTEHFHPGLGQRGRGPVREVCAVANRGVRVPRRRPGPGARLPPGRVRRRVARAQGPHVRQHQVRDVRQRGPVRQHHLQEPGRGVRLRGRPVAERVDSRGCTAAADAARFGVVGAAAACLI